jgi:dolichol-phosphate mannosyltransferase
MLKRFIQFGLVGGTGVLVDMTVLVLLADPRTLGWNLSVSKAIAAEVAILNNFIWNDLWTFRDLSADQPGWRSRSNRFGKFNLICLAGIALNILVLNLEVHWLDINVYVANLAAIFVVSLWNFWMNLRFGWTPATCPRTTKDDTSDPVYH